jgi:hypothetical protein
VLQAPIATLTDPRTGSAQPAGGSIMLCV